MPDVLLQLLIKAPPAKVFGAFSTPLGLDSWWTERSSGHAQLDAIWRLYFGPEYDWRARVTKFVPEQEFEWTILEAMDDWIGTRVGVTLHPVSDGTVVDFYHRGWAEPSEHFRISNYCWATYLRLMKRYIEFGEFVPYDQRDIV